MYDVNMQDHKLRQAEFNFNLQGHKLRQAELIQEAEKVRLIQSLKGNQFHSRGFARKIQGLISIILP